MNPLLGILLRIAATVAFVLMNLLVQILSRRIPVGELVFARSFFGLIPVLLLTAYQGRFIAAFRANSYGGHVLRATTGSVGVVCGFIALSMLPLADTIGIGYMIPVFSVLLGALLLREHVHAYRWVASGLGFLGVMIMLSDYVPGQAGGATERSLIGAGIALFGTVFSALTTVQIRRLNRTEAADTIVIYFAVWGSVAALLTLPFGWVIPTWQDFLLLVAVGIVGGSSQVLMTFSLKHADVSILAPFDYLTLIWAVLLSYLAYATLPTPAMVVGALVVIAAGLFVFHRERRAGPVASSPGHVR